MFEHFYSDPHFGHASIIGFCNRPYADVWEMNEDLVGRYNVHVKKTDTVLWLGDAFFGKSDEATAFLDRLNGKKAIVLGNHDRKANWFLERGFIFALHEVAFTLEGHNMRACHFPARLTPRDLKRAERFRYPLFHEKEWLLHGHIHSTERHWTHGHIHCGVDAWDYRPVSAGEICSIIRKTEEQ